MPKTLTFGALSAALSAVVAIAAAIVIYTIGDSLLTDLLNAQSGAAFSVDQAKEAGASLINNPFDILQNRAGFWIAVAVTQLALVPSLRLGQTWARICFPIFSLGGAALRVYDMTDDGIPTLLKVLDGAGIAFTLVAIVLVWLGPSNRYVKARKAFRRGQPLAA